jgi:hypothetical protein
MNLNLPVTFQQIGISDTSKIDAISQHWIRRVTKGSLVE